jgi:hypothetical protein
VNTRVDWLAFLPPAAATPPVALKTLTARLTQVKVAAPNQSQVRLAVVSAETSISLDPIQKHLAGKRFATDVDVKQAVIS